MTAEQNTDRTEKTTKRWKKPLFVSIAIVLIGGIVTFVIFMTEPTAERSGATKETAMLVNVTEVKRDTFNPTVVSMGTVEPSQEIVLSPRVSGEIISRSEAFTPGSFVNKGQKLLQIDPSDYKNTLQSRESDLRQAIADLKIEMGRQNIAEKDYQLLNETLSEEQEALILRKPQLNAARSAVEDARAAVNQAELDLQRTAIKAPFDAHILSRNVNVGSQVSPGENMGRLVGRDTYWVEATVPLAKLRRLKFPKDEMIKGAEVRIQNRTAWEEEEYREGHLYKLVGTLEERTRMARVLVTVSDPLAYLPENSEKPEMMIGSFVEAQIKAEPIPDVVRLNRDYLRSNETVWVMKENKLRIRDVKIVFQDSKYAYIKEGLNEDDKVVTTNLTTVVDGAALRMESDTTSNEDTVKMN